MFNFQNIYENRIIKKDIRYDLIMFTVKELQWIKDNYER